MAALLLAAAFAPAVGCGNDGARPVTMAGTTSTYDSGLLDSLMTAYRRSPDPYDIRAIAVGSGEALALGRRGDVDLLLVHSPAAEYAFLEAGHGDERVPLMYNDFVVVGPPDDPADVRNAATAAEAFEAIARHGARFLSRGDSSGTHVREVEIWRSAGSPPRGQWYAESGQGQGQTLQIAGERGAYTLADRPTFLVLRPGLRLDILHERDPALTNLYSLIRVRRARNLEGAGHFAAWLTSARGRRVIARFGKEQFGESLFHPLVVGEVLPLPGPAGEEFTDGGPVEPDADGKIREASPPGAARRGTADPGRNRVGGPR